MMKIFSILKQKIQDLYMRRDPLEWMELLEKKVKEESKLKQESQMKNQKN